MKKKLSLLLAAACLVSMLAGCNSSKQDESSVEQLPDATPAAEVSAAPEQAVVTADPVIAPPDAHTDLDPEQAQVLVEDTYDVWAVLLHNCDGELVFRCYDEYDAVNDKFLDYVGLVSINIHTGQLTVLDGMVRSEDAAAAPSASPSPSAAPEEKVVATMYVANVDYACYLLNSNDPSHADIIDTVNLGTKVDVLDNTGIVFYKVRYNNKTGYINKAFLSDKRPPESYPIIDYMYINHVECAAYLWADDKGETSLATINLGARVGLIEKTNKTFYMVNYKGMIGYVNNAYLELTEPASNVKVQSYLYVANVKTACYLWADSYGQNQVDTIPLGTKLGFVEKANATFWKVTFKDQVGYVNCAYLSESDPLAPQPTATPAPTAAPAPTAEPTPAPAPTAEPTPEPTAEPTPEPTAEPTPEPTAEPTPEPTAEPTPDPTPKPPIDDAKEFTMKEPAEGNLSTEGQKDAWCVKAEEGTVYFSLTPDNPKAIGNIVIDVFSSDGTVIASTDGNGVRIDDDNEGNLCASVKLQSDDTCYIRVSLKQGYGMRYTLKAEKRLLQ